MSQANLESDRRSKRFEDLMAMADQAAASARLLLDVGDMDGACDRAGNCVFSAARAALLTVDVVDSPAATAWRYADVGHAFEHHFADESVFAGCEVSSLVGRALALRQMANYGNEPVAASEARPVVDQLPTFLAAIRDRFGTA